MVLSLIYNHLNDILQARLLQDETTNNADNKEETTTSDTNNSLTQTQIIRDTCIIYGSIFAFLFILFLILRPYYPTVYNIKKCYPKLQLLHRDAAAADESKSDDNKHAHGAEREETENNDEHNQIAAVDENEYHTVDNDGSMHSTNYITPSSTLPDASPALPQSTSKNNNIANNTYGPISWMYKILDINDTDICEECGVDALTTIRLLDLGVKLSFVGVINSVRDFRLLYFLDVM